MKTHYQPNRHKEYLQCGAIIKRNTETTFHLDAVTCRVCMFSYLAEQAPWARDFLNELRGAMVADKRRVPIDVVGKGGNGEFDPKALALARGFRPGLGSFEEMEARVMAAGPTAFDRVNPDGMPPALVLAADFGGSVGAGAHGVPMGPSAHAHSPVERLGRSLASLLSNDGVPQKAIRELLPQAEALAGAVEPVMEHGGTAASAVGVKPWKVAEQPGDAGQVSQETFRDF